MASGTILGYGIDSDILHVPGDTNVAFWVVVPNYSAMDKKTAAIDEFITSHPQLMGDMISMIDAAANHDLIVRAREANHRAVPAGAKPIADFDMVRVKSGHMGEFMEMFRTYDKPVFDKLVADGTIYSYEVDSEAVHTMEPGLVWTIIDMPDLGTKDKVDAAFEATESKIPKEEREKLEKQYNDLIVEGSHRDSLSVSEVFKMK